MAVTLALMAVAACGSDGDDGADESEIEAGSESESSGSGSAPADDGGAPGADEAAGPCDVVDVAAVEGALGGTLGEGDARTTSVTENDLSWTAVGCEWTTDGDVEVQLRMVAADDLPGECPPLASPVYDISELPDLGDAAWWEWDSMEGEGAVRVCTAAGMAESRVESADDAPLDEATVQAAAIALVTPAVAAL